MVLRSNFILDEFSRCQPRWHLALGCCVGLGIVSCATERCGSTRSHEPRNTSPGEVLLSQRDGHQYCNLTIGTSGGSDQRSNHWYCRASGKLRCKQDLIPLQPLVS